MNRLSLAYNELELPILQYVRDNTLSIRNYFLEPGHCKALCTALKSMEPSSLNSLILEHNGLDDAGVAELIEGMNRFSSVHKVHIIGNEVGVKSIKMLELFAERQKQH